MDEWGGGKEVGRVEGGDTVIRVNFMRKSLIAIK